MVITRLEKIAFELVKKLKLAPVIASELHITFFEMERLGYLILTPEEARPVALRESDPDGPLADNESVCPYCKAVNSGVRLKGVLTEDVPGLGDVILLTSYCGNNSCHKILSTQYIKPAQAAAGVGLHIPPMPPGRVRGRS